MRTSVADEFFYCHRKENPVSTPTDENRSLLTVVAYMRAAEGKTEELRAALEALIEPTTGEEGYVNYDLFSEISCCAMGSNVLKLPHRWAGLLSDKWCAEPRSEPDSGNPTVRDRRAALRNVASHAYGDLVRALNFEPDNRMHGLTGGGWKRKRYRPRSKRKLPGGNPRQERPDLQPNQSPPRQPPTLLDRDHWCCSSVVVALARSVLVSSAPGGRGRLRSGPSGPATTGPSRS